MSFSIVLKVANRGFVYPHGQKLTHFQILLYHHTSVANHKTSAQKLGITGLH